MIRKKAIFAGIIIGSLSMAAIFQNRYPIPVLLAVVKVETNLANIVKIDNTPIRYLVKVPSFIDSENGVKIAQADGGSEWMQDFIINGNRYRADWTIYLGRYRIYTIKT